MTRFLTAGALAVGLLFSGCDAAGPADDLDTTDIAATVASAFALDTGGALDEAAQAAVGAGYAGLRDAGHGGHGFGRLAGGACESDASADGDATRVTISCARGGDRRSATLDRTVRFAYTDAAGQPVPTRDGAAALAFSVLSGTSTAVSPRATREVTESRAAYAVTGLGTDAVTVNGTSSRAGSVAVTRPDGSTRRADYTVTLALTDVTGPSPQRVGVRAFRGRWQRAASGTAEGVYRATVTTTGADGESTTETVERPFTVAFPVDGEGRARVRVGGRDHRADTGSGDVD